MCHSPIDLTHCYKTAVFYWDWDMVFTRFSGYCLLWCWLLTFWYRKLISTSMNPNTSVAKIGWKSINWFLRYTVHNVFGSVRDVTLTFDLLIPQANQHNCEPKYTCDRNWAKFSSFVLDIWCSHYFGTHPCTHSCIHALSRGRTDANTVCFQRRYSTLAER